MTWQTPAERSKIISVVADDYKQALRVQSTAASATFNEASAMGIGVAVVSGSTDERINENDNFVVFGGKSVAATSNKKQNRLGVTPTRSTALFDGNTANASSFLPDRL